MKLYHLNPNGYGEEWFVMAESKDKALEAILTKLSLEADEADYHNRQNKKNGYAYCDTTCERDTFDMVKVFVKTGSMKAYSLDEYDAYQVISSEIA